MDWVLFGVLAVFGLTAAALVLILLSTSAGQVSPEGGGDRPIETEDGPPGAVGPGRDPAPDERA